MTQDYISEARELAASEPGLGSLIQFVRAHDPTRKFREEWGSQYDVELAEVLSTAATSLESKEVFAGTPEELLLCMAHLVASAPHIGVPESHVRTRLLLLIDLLLQRARAT